MAGLRGFCAAILIWLCALFGLSLSGCWQRTEQETQTGFETESVRLEAPLTCYNEFLGIAYTIPKGWRLYDLNTANFSPEPADTADPAALDIFYGDGFRRMDMARFTNGRLPAGKNHLDVYVYAESRDDSGSLEEYMPRFEASLKTRIGGDCALVDSGAETAGANLFERRVFEFTRNERPLRLTTLSAAFRDGYFLNIIAAYKPENKNTRLIPLPLDH